MMIISTNQLTPEQHNEISLFMAGHNTPLFLEADINFYEDFPCFQLLYEKNKLCAFLSVFIPCEEECEIYAFTSFSERNKGYFHALYKKVFPLIQEYNIQRPLFVTENEDACVHHILNKFHSHLYTSDYMMAYVNGFIPKPKRILSLKKTKKNNDLIYKACYDNNPVGGCKCNFANKAQMIYDFEIHETQRKKGFGTETLLLVLEDLIKNQEDNILLHITGDNEIAHNMYLKNGFENIRQINYWKH